MGLFDRVRSWFATAPEPVHAPPMPDPEPAQLPELRVHMPSLWMYSMGNAGVRADSQTNHLSALGSGLDKGQVTRPRRIRHPLTFRELENLYRDNGYVRRIIDKIPADASRRGWEVTSEERAVEGLAAEEKRLGVKTRLKEGRRSARLHGGSAILLVTDDDVPAEYAGRESDWLLQPLDLDRVNSVLNLVVMDESEFSALEMETDLRSPYFGRPKVWTCSPTGSGESLAVHSSRLILMVGAPLSPSARYNEWGLGDSVIQAAWDQVKNRTSVDQAGAVQAQQVTQDVITLEDLGRYNSDEQAAAFNTRMVQLSQGLSALNTLLLSQGEAFERKEANLSGWNNLDAGSRASLQAVVGLSETSLFGTSPGGLNTDGKSGRLQLSDLIEAVQEEHWRDPLERLYSIIFAAKKGPFKGREPDNWSLSFRPIDQPTPMEEALLRKTIAETDVMMEPILGADHIARSRYRATGYSTEMLPFKEGDLTGDLEAEMDRQAMRASIEQAADEALKQTGTERADADDTRKPPPSMVSNARKAIAWRREHGSAVKGGTSVGWGMARKIATGNPLSLKDIRKIAGFVRFEEDYRNAVRKKRSEGKPPWSYNAITAWMIWGGTTGIAWAREVSEANPRTDAQGTEASKPAPPEDQVRGSKTNPEGSASGTRGGIELNDATKKALRDKVAQHNEEHGDDASKKVDVGMLQAVYRRGAGAYSTSHDPKMSRGAWSMARVNAFLKLVRAGRPDNAKYTGDFDLLPKGHPKKPE